MGFLLFAKMIPLILLIQVNTTSVEPSVPKKDESLNSGIFVMVPTGEMRDSYPVLEPLPADDPGNQTIHGLFRETFLHEMIVLHEMVQHFTEKSTDQGRKEPLYLLLSGRMGGFPMQGFFLKNKDSLIDKTGVPYVDLPDLEQNYQRLNSITQIFPHEQAHLFYHRLTSADPSQTPSYSSDIHYFSIVTDYYKAFDEGFAESFENISRKFEQNEEIRKGIETDIESIQKTMPGKLSGFKRDFTWPIRIGYYRLTMLFWYQQLENYKRSVWVSRGWAKYQPATLHHGTLRKKISWRAACTEPDSSRIKNHAQAASNEGVINTFFTLLMESHAKDHFLPTHFYTLFVSDTTGIQPGGKILTPVRNQLLKEFYIIRQYLTSLPEGHSPFHHFIVGYITEFPDEKELVLRIYRESTGLSFQNSSIPEVWILNQHFKHTPWVMDQFGWFRQPFYTFNLNTADQTDFMTIAGMTLPDAEKIMDARHSSGYFQNGEEIVNIPGLRLEVAEQLISRKLQPSELQRIENEHGFELTFRNFLLRSLSRLLWISGIILIPVTLILFFLFCYAKKTTSHIIGLIIRTYLKTIVFVLAGLVTLVFPVHPMFIFLPFVCGIFLINFLRTGHDPFKRKEILLSSFFLAFAVGYSLI